MAEIVDLAADAALGPRLERDRPPAAGEQPGDQPQQRRLAGAVRPDHREHLAGREAERDAREDRPPAARGRESVAVRRITGRSASCTRN